MEQAQRAIEFALLRDVTEADAQEIAPFRLHHDLQRNVVWHAEGQKVGTFRGRTNRICRVAKRGVEQTNGILLPVDDGSLQADVASALAPPYGAVVRQFRARHQRILHHARDRRYNIAPRRDEERLRHGVWPHEDVNRIDHHRESEARLAQTSREISQQFGAVSSGVGALKQHLGCLKRFRSVLDDALGERRRLLSRQPLLVFATVAQVRPVADKRQRCRAVVPSVRDVLADVARKRFVAQAA
mmetsp:Transcript_24062/g.83520  ORF Transcript_24062/g.83520 Transcript_24062/m.83520 type:complete len:243 (+) Transcript_24062:1289-2017(+)